jgi:hypothetical protein
MRDVRWFFHRHPVAHFVSMFCLLFTAFSIVDALLHQIDVSRFMGTTTVTAITSGGLVFFTRRADRKDPPAPPNA